MIDTAAATWGCQMADYLSRRMLWHVHRHLGDGPFARAQKRLLRYLQDRGGQASRRDVSREMRSCPPRMLDDVLKSLLLQERIVATTIKTSRKAADG